MQFDYGQTSSLFAKKKHTDNSFATEAAWTRTKELDLFTDFQILLWHLIQLYKTILGRIKSTMPG